MLKFIQFFNVKLMVKIIINKYTITMTRNNFIEYILLTKKKSLKGFYRIFDELILSWNYI